MLLHYLVEVKTPKM